MPELDHRYVTPPYLRVVREHSMAAGGSVYVWDLRVGQPNIAQIGTRVMHSMEHFLGTHLRNADASVINIAPMGCQTGFYIVATNGAFAHMSSLLAEALSAIQRADAVPLASVVECGWAANHSLTEAQELAAWLVRHRNQWADPGTTIDGETRE